MNYNIDFETIEYERAHGKLPRGRGSWAFCPRQNYNAPNYLDHVMWFNGTYTEAKKRARAYFATKPGNPVIVVCS